jgi:hypothetical protein
MWEKNDTNCLLSDPSLNTKLEQLPLFYTDVMANYYNGPHNSDSKTGEIKIEYTP